MSTRNELLERILAAILSGGGNPQDVRVEPAGDYTLNALDDDVLFSVAATPLPLSPLSLAFQTKDNGGQVSDASANLYFTRTP